MKNIHLIKTDKPSRLHKIGNELGLTDKPNNNFLAKQQNIYITNDEEIKEGDWILYCNSVYKVLRINSNNRPVVKMSDGEFELSNWNKIILTDNKDLIKDGVQPIDDKFLEWFIQNPSCEEIEIEQEKSIGYAGDRQRTFYGKYKIIIPKEETTAYHYLSCCRSVEECHCGKYPKQELERGITITHKQETLKEFANKAYPFYGDVELREAIELGAKWQQERRYSEEYLVELLNFVTKEYNISNGIGWFHTHDSIEDVSSKEVLEQFKKK